MNIFDGYEEDERESLFESMSKKKEKKMKHKVGDIVVVCSQNEDFFDAIISRKPQTILDIFEYDYLLGPGNYVTEEDIISLNVAINNLESLISKAKKQLKIFKKLKESRNAT